MACLTFWGYFRCSWCETRSCSTEVRRQLGRFLFHPMGAAEEALCHNRSVRPAVKPTAFAARSGLTSAEVQHTHTRTLAHTFGDFTFVMLFSTCMLGFPWKHLALNPTPPPYYQSYTASCVSIDWIFSMSPLKSAVPTPERGRGRIGGKPIPLSARCGAENKARYLENANKKPHVHSFPPTLFVCLQQQHEQQKHVNNGNFVICSLLKGSPAIPANSS